MFREELKKHDNKVRTSQLAQTKQSHIPWKDNIYSQIKGPEKKRRVRCTGKIPKPKKLKVILFENQEVCNKVKKMEEKHKQMEEKQESTNVMLANVLSFIQNWYTRENVNDNLRAARHVYFILLFKFIFRVCLVVRSDYGKRERDDKMS